MRRTPLLLLLLLAAPATAAGPGEAVIVADADAARLSPYDASQTRYLDYGEIPEAERKDFLLALLLHVNHLSREADFAKLRIVSPDVLAIRLDDFGPVDGPFAKSWEKLGDFDRVFHATIETEEVKEYGYWVAPNGTTSNNETSGAKWRTTRTEKTGKKTRKSAASPNLPTKEIVRLIERTQSSVPIVRAHWFYVQTQRVLGLNNKENGIGYSDFLGVKSRDDLFKLVRLDIKASRDVQKEIRAALDKSGVSQQNRQIVRFQALTGGVWITLDVKDETGKGNAIRNLKVGDYVHDAEEIYYVLPNGLPGMWAGDAQGVLQASAPDFIGPDDSPLRTGNDGRIHQNRSCWNCHAGEVLKPIDDWARRTYAEGTGVKLTSPDYNVEKELKRQYLRDIDRFLKRDREDYQDAIKACNGLTAGENAKLFAHWWDRYVQSPLNLADAAREIGCTAAHLRAALLASQKATGYLDPLLAGLLAGGKLKRTQWDEVYQQTAAISKGYLLP
jgi:hypothetical protein